MKRTLAKASTSVLTAFVPAYLSCISSYAFYGCSSLAELSAPSSLSIGEYAFYGCNALRNIVSGREGILSTAIPYGLTYNVPKAAFYGCSSLANAKLLSSVGSIGPSAFYGCESISSFTDEAALSAKRFWSLSSIASNAFQGCTSLTSFEIPAALKHIGADTFKGCTSLQQMNIDMLADDFVAIVSADCISSAVVSAFGSMNDDGLARINFNDIAYMNNGVVKVDSEFIEGCTYEYANGNGNACIALSSIDYNKFNLARQQYLNLSAISRVD